MRSTALLFYPQHTLGMDRLNSKEDEDDRGVMLRSMRELEGGGGGGMSVALPAIRPAPGAANAAWPVRTRKGRLRPLSTAGKVERGGEDVGRF